MGNKLNKYKENNLLNEYDITSYLFDDFILIKIDEHTISLKEIDKFISYLKSFWGDKVRLSYLKAKNLEYSLSKDILCITNRLINQKFENEIEYFLVLQIKIDFPSIGVYSILLDSFKDDENMLDKFFNTEINRCLRFKRNGCNILVLL